MASAEILGSRPSWVAALCGCVLGAAWQVTQARLWALWAYPALMICGGPWMWALWHFRETSTSAWLRTAWRWLGPLLATACLVAGLSGWRAHVYLAQTLPQSLEAIDIEVEGQIASMLQDTGNGQRWRFAVDQAQMPGVPGLIELSWYGPFGQEMEVAAPRQAPWAHGLALAPGQRWRMTVRIKRPHGSRNPHGFDYELLQWEQGVQAAGYVRESPEPVLLEAGSDYRIQRGRQWLRDRIRAQADRLERWWPQTDALTRQKAIGIVAALAVGDQQAIERSDWALFRQTGVAHLMSISGLHITMFSWVAALLVGRLWRLSASACRLMPAQRMALLAGVLLALAYALFSGWGVPAQRTVCMLAVVALLQWLGLRWPWPVVWLLALAAVLVADPWALWQAGFWLSFVAVGVLLAGNRRPKPVFEAESTPQARPGQRLLHQGVSLWREQWLISLVLAPLSLLLFGQVSLVGLIANLIAIPWVTLLVTPLALLSALIPQTAAVAAWLLLPLMQFLQWLAAANWAVWSLPQPAWWASVAAVVAGLLLVAPLPGRLRCVLAFCCVPALWWPQARVGFGEFELLAADIGQGNAVLVSTQNHRLLYDAGPQYGQSSDAGERVLLPLFSALGVRLDRMMLSHRDADHTGGALAVKSAQPQVEVWGSESVVEDLRLAALTPVERCTAGRHWQWDGVTFEVLHPAADFWEQARKPSPNAGSCVLRIRSAFGRVALLVGDIEAAQEQLLLEGGLTAPVDWLLVPHHGSKTSSSTNWVQGLRPHWAVVQAGYINRFGHPVAAVVQRYEQVGSQLVLQDRCGAALWRSSAPLSLQCERRLRAHYWDVHQQAPP